MVPRDVRSDGFRIHILMGTSLRTGGTACSTFAIGMGPSKFDMSVWRAAGILT